MGKKGKKPKKEEVSEPAQKNEAGKDPELMNEAGNKAFLAKNF